MYISWGKKTRVQKARLEKLRAFRNAQRSEAIRNIPLVMVPKHWPDPRDIPDPVVHDPFYWYLRSCGWDVLVDPYNRGKDGKVTEPKKTAVWLFAKASDCSEFVEYEKEIAGLRRKRKTS
jgi:hypothetical protein